MANRNKITDGGTSSSAWFIGSATEEGKIRSDDLGFHFEDRSIPAPTYRDIYAMIVRAIQDIRIQSTGSAFYAGFSAVPGMTGNAIFQLPSGFPNQTASLIVSPTGAISFGLTNLTGGVMTDISGTVINFEPNKAGTPTAVPPFEATDFLVGHDSSSSDARRFTFADLDSRWLNPDPLDFQGYWNPETGLDGDGNPVTVTNASGSANQFWWLAAGFVPQYWNRTTGATQPTDPADGSILIEPYGEIVHNGATWQYRPAKPFTVPDSSQVIHNPTGESVETEIENLKANAEIWVMGNVLAGNLDGNNRLKLITVPAGYWVKSCHTEVTTAFSAGITGSIGTLTQPDRVMPSSYLDLQEVGLNSQTIGDDLSSFGSQDDIYFQASAFAAVGGITVALCIVKVQGFS